MQRGQVFELKKRAVDGRSVWAYRYRTDGPSSRRLQRGGFSSERDAAEALERALEHLRRQKGVGSTLTLKESLSRCSSSTAPSTCSRQWSSPFPCTGVVPGPASAATRADEAGRPRERKASISRLTRRRSGSGGSINGSHTWRTLSTLQVEPREKMPIYRDFGEPSDGLEPSTPSLPWRCSTN